MPRSWGYRTLRVAGGWRSAPLAFRPASFARRVGSKLGQALPQHLWPTPNQHVSSYNPRPLAPILSNLARNSPAAPSNIEFASLELQRFPTVSKNYRLKLCARFIWARPAITRRHRGQAHPQHLWPTPNQHVSSYNPRSVVPLCWLGRIGHEGGCAPAAGRRVQVRGVGSRCGASGPGAGRWAQVRGVAPRPYLSDAACG